MALVNSRNKYPYKRKLILYTLYEGNLRIAIILTNGDTMNTETATSKKVITAVSKTYLTVERDAFLLQYGFIDTQGAMWTATVYEKNGRSHLLHIFDESDKPIKKKDHKHYLEITMQLIAKLSNPSKIYLLDELIVSREPEFPDVQHIPANLSSWSTQQLIQDFDNAYTLTDAIPKRTEVKVTNTQCVDTVHTVSVQLNGGSSAFQFTYQAVKDKIVLMSFHSDVNDSKLRQYHGFIAALTVPIMNPTVDQYEIITSQAKWAVEESDTYHLGEFKKLIEHNAPTVTVNASAAKAVFMTRFTLNIKVNHEPRRAKPSDHVFHNPHWMNPPPVHPSFPHQAYGYAPPQAYSQCPTGISQHRLMYYGTSRQLLEYAKEINLSLIEVKESTYYFAAQLTPYRPMMPHGSVATTVITLNDHATPPA